MSRGRAAKLARENQLAAFYSDIAGIDAVAPTNRLEVQRRPGPTGRPPRGVRMKDADVDRCVDFLNHLFLSAKHGTLPPRNVDIHERPDGSIWIAFFVRDGRIAVVDLRLRNRLQASISLAMLAEVLERLGWASGCADPTDVCDDQRRDPIDHDSLRTLLQFLGEGRRTLGKITEALLDADVILPRQNVKSAYVFVVAADEVSG